MRLSPVMRLLVAAARYNIIRNTPRRPEAGKALVEAAEGWWRHLTPATRTRYEQRVEVACRHGEPCLWNACPRDKPVQIEPPVEVNEDG